MSADNALERAKTELQEHDRLIGLLDAEKNRIEMQRVHVLRERDRVRAFIDLFAKFVLDAGSREENAADESRALLSSGKGSLIGATESSGHGTRGAQPKTKSKKDKRGKNAKLQRKPEGIPTMPQMVILALKDARANGKPGLTPHEITKFVASKWWPSVKGPSVGPIAWRMYARKELQKDGEIYMLPAESSGSSKPQMPVWPTQAGLRVVEGTK